MTSNLAALFASANNACARGVSTREFEPSFARLLDEIHASSDCREQTAALLIDGMRTGVVAWELIAYLMYELRWPEVKEAAEQQLERERDPRIQVVMSHILDAFSDDWDAIDMYRRWSR